VSRWVAEAVCSGLDVGSAAFEAFRDRRIAVLEEFLLRGEVETCLLVFLEKESPGRGAVVDCALLQPGRSWTTDAPKLAGRKQIYFCKTTSEPITDCGDGKQIEFGVLSGNPLSDLHDLIKEIYIPLLGSNSSLSEKYEFGGPEMDPAKNEEASSPIDHGDLEEEKLDIGLPTHNERKEKRMEKNGRNKNPDDDVKRDTDGLSDEKDESAELWSKELRSSMLKFRSQIEHALQQVHGDVHIKIPNVNVDNIDVVVDDYDTVSALEGALEDWSKTIANVLETETKKSPLRPGPLAEIEFWRARSASLTSLYEQLNISSVQQMLRVLERVEATILPTFRFHFAELTKLHVEAKDNVKFLSTLERHFKSIGSGSLSVVLDTVPSMMNAIRMVWIISRHYNTDDRMVPLMERIAEEISGKVAREIDIQTFFERNPGSALKIIGKAKKVLESWYKTYMSIREKIEVSGTDHRWEFDRKRLFEQTNYMAKICEDLFEVGQVLDQFQKFLGPELKAVTGDSEGIDRVMGRVKALVQPLESVPFDIFDRHHKSNWEDTMTQFRENVFEIENMTRVFIDTSFQRLRSSEGAFDLLQNFQNIQSRQAINKQMMQKFDDILVQYGKELECVRATFTLNMNAPPVFKNHPPVAGAIAWAKHLFYRVKRPIMRFRTMETWFEDSETWQHIMNEYLDFAKSVKDYCKVQFESWEQQAQLSSLLLQEPVFGPPLVRLASEHQGLPGSSPKASKKTKLELPEPPYFVNFSDKLVRLIRETKYLDRMDYKVPEAALNVALQEEKYHAYVQSLKELLRNYHEVVGSLSPVEFRLLSGRLKELQSEIRQGFSPCNWRSLHISTLIDRCSKATSEFQGVIAQIRKNTCMIEEVIDCIENCELIDVKHFTSLMAKSAGQQDGTLGLTGTIQEEQNRGGTLEISVIYETIDKTCQEKIRDLSRKYRSVGPLLVKIEEIVSFSNSGSSPVLAEFYKFWEKRMYNAITVMVIRGIASFEVLLNLRQEDDEEVDDIDFTLANGLVKLRPPICRAHASLSGSDVSVNPALTDIYKYVSKTVRNIVEASKAFPRWMRGTCKECEPISYNEDEETVVFSFFPDVSKNPHVIKHMLGLNHSFQQTFAIVRRYLDTWQRYDEVYGLWDAKKKEQLHRLREKKPSYVYFDTRISIYSRLADGVRSQPSQKDIGFLKIDCNAVQAGLAEKAQDWTFEYGRILFDIAKQKLKKVLDYVEESRLVLNSEPEDLNELKHVLHTITTISEATMEKELEIADVMESFRTLRKYKLTPALLCAPDDANMPMVTSPKSAATVLNSLEDSETEVEDAFERAEKLDETWRMLLHDSKTKDLRMNAVKEKFKEVTQSEAEQFVARVRDNKNNFSRSGPGTKAGNESELDDGLQLLAAYSRKLKDLFKEREGIVNAQRLFGLDPTPYPELTALQAELSSLGQIFGLYSELKAFESEMSSMLWSELDVHALLKGAEHLEKKLRKLPKELRQRPTFSAVEQAILRFKDSIPLIQSLKNDSMKKRHWEGLAKVTGVRLEMNLKTFTLGALFSMKLARFDAEISEIVNEANQEAKIEKVLKDIAEKWHETSFGVAKYSKGGVDKGFVLRSCDDIKLELEDNMLNLQTMSGSRFVVSFSDVVRKWETSLNHVLETIDIWFKVQSKWMYLESIFIGAEDIRMQLPEEAKKFDQVDKGWKGLMASTAKNPNVVEACHADNRIETLNALSERLDLCQKSLSDYLDTKRNVFPRFFFISDDELLSVLGSSDPTSIQVHMLKLFDNTKFLKFGRGANTVIGMGSNENEEFSFTNPTAIEGPVEIWMTSVESEMRESLHRISKEGVFYYAKSNRVDWVDQNLGMVGLLGSQIWWTWEVQDVFRRVRDGDKHAMKGFAEKLTSQLNELVDKVREQITKHMRKKVNCLLIIDVHARDIVDKFVRDSILDEREFAWESQLRFYWDQVKDNVEIRQCTGSFDYGYEFMGLNGRLVITPLTDRCYMTITQAHTFHLGTAPAGPAGTGKTETVKDLAKGMALPCFVINCGEGIDFLAMASTFSGLAQIGAWGCFDEFNRINIEVLSVVSAQLQAIQGALKAGRDRVDIGLGMEIRLDKKIGVFVTMNPGYAGRTELPDNLKALFRPVTMIVPDLLQICEIMLFSEGFGQARNLAKKMTTLYSLAKGQLSKQFHYDFGLRALKSVLVMAGGLKRQYTEMSEDLVLMRALRDSNMPKFVFDDVPLFRGLVADLFPGFDCPRVAFEVLKVAIEEYLVSNSFRPSRDETFHLQVDKTIQMYETMLTRHTCMIVGPTGGGKSVVLKCLQSAQGKAFEESVKTFTLNPKAQTLAELYGEMDPVTRDWTDGVLSNLFRSMNEPLPAGKENEIRWLVFDGDVDALWIENMNSVMDDNRLLTLPNGERIRLQNYCKLIMETFDLQYASPATISRCGMVYVDPKNIGYRPFFERWIKTRSFSTGYGNDDHEDDGCGKVDEAHIANLLLDLFDTYVPKAVDFVLEGVLGDRIVERPSQVIPITNLSMVRQLCSLLDANFAISSSFKSNSDDDATLPQKSLNDGDVEGLFVFAVTWAIGGQLLEESRSAFSEMIAQCSETSLPTNLFDSFYNASSGKWEGWETRVPEYQQPSPFQFNSILVPTKENVLYTYLLEINKTVEAPVLFVGEPGTAKTVTIQNFINQQSVEKHMKLNLNFSSRTTSLDVQNNIIGNVDKRTGRIYGPSGGKQLLIFIDDMNMPIVDTYGTQAPIALLHFLIGKGAMYDRGKDFDLRIYKGLHFFAAMGPPGGGRNNVDPRFISLFNLFNLTPPSEAVLMHIYSSIISSCLNERFEESMISIGLRITACTLKLFDFLLESLPPTPAKFHYVFNLRDLGRVFEGLCRATPDEFEGNPQAFVRLWRNECERVFFDRLISEDDQKLVSEQFRGILDESFPEHAEEIMIDPILFGDFEDAPARLAEEAEDPMIYKDFGSFRSVQKIFDEVLELYNVDNKPMSLVLFDMAVEHLCRIYRVLRLPLGHCLLIGVGGSGKQSITRLASFACGYETFEIVLSRGYGEKEFREDIKSLYKKLGNGPVVFIFTDAHVVEEGFLELLNNMLTTGMVPALLENDEKDAACNSVRQEAKAARIIDTKDNLWAFYVQKCRMNLHIVLAMSPSGETLRVRCRNFPGLVSGCVIDWFFPWPADALQSVAKYFLQDEAFSEEQRQNIVDHMVIVHQGVIDASEKFYFELRRHNYVTPKNFLDYISNYRGCTKEKKRSLNESIKRLTGGLTKLEEAEVSVDALSKELASKKVVVDRKTKDCQAMIDDINEKQTVAAEQQDAAEIKKKELEESNVIIVAQKAKADEQLQEALPALEAAAEALDNLDKNDITEIKAFASPPPAVAAVCMCVVCLKPTGTEDDSAGWKGAKAMIGQSNFLQSLKTFDKDGITEKMIRKVKAYFRDPEFNMENMKKISKAGAGLFQWVIAIVKYYDVAKNVEPLENKVRDLEKQKAAAEKELGEIMETLKKLEVQLNELNTKFKAANSELTALRDEAQIMERRLTAASKLIDGLSSEKVRWGKDLAIMEQETVQLVGDCLLGASFLSYLGVFTSKYRRQLLEDVWIPDVRERQIPLSEDFRIESLLTSDVEVQKWNGEGLPGDDHSIQNGILTTNCSRFPLCIDPQQQAVKWIKRKEADHNITVRNFNDGDFMKHLELAIQFGNPYLFENVDEDLDPMIDPVLERNTIVENGQRMIVLGDKKIDWDPNFRLYMTTKLANPHYTPEIMGKTMIINYSVTVSGLADQLLNVVVGHERADIEEKFAEIVSQMSENVQALAALEDTLLKTLASSQGNILDNEELISTLDEAKTKAVDIHSQIETATFTKEEIQAARKQYEPVAKRGSTLFFALSGLSTLMKMYETSLSSFLTVFSKSLDDAKKDGILENRLANMIEEATRQLYDYTCTGIFERHKLMFSMQLTCMIMEGDGELNREQLDFFLKGDTTISEDGAAANKKPSDWISESGWKDILKLETISDKFAGLAASVSENELAWNAWYELETPETSPFPLGFNDRLNSFERLLLTRCFRPDRVYNAVKLFIIGHPKLGDYFVQPPVLNFRRIYNQSTSTIPMVFILSPGADPALDIQALGEELGYAGTIFKTVSLGQGQGPLAMQLLETGAARGHWVLLQNCHLLISWLRKLEKTLETMQKVHPNFRLWMTTDPTDKFPMGILQRSLKVVTEPPDGLKLNMRSTLARLDETVLEECTHYAYRPLVYVLTFLHAVVQERRKYGKIGFNVAYDFAGSDYAVSRKLISLYLNKAEENGDEMVPWGSIAYLVGSAMYGGRVSDDYDRRVLLTYVDEYMGDFLFDETRKFFFSREGFDYGLPSVSTLDALRQAVERMPLNCGPAVFGLNPNAEIGYLTNATRSLWKDLIDLQPRTAANSEGMSREEVIARSATSIEEVVPEPVDIIVVKKKFEAPSPTEVVLLQELERWNFLVQSMKNSLVDLRRALKGEIGMSEALDELATSLFNGYLPAMWRRLCPETQKGLASWMEHFRRRLDQYKHWIENGEPKVIWLSGLHIPESYLTALVQAACRAKNWPLDKSVIYTKVTSHMNADEVSEHPNMGCFVQGLYLEGARWDLQEECLMPQLPKVLVQELPLLRVIPIEASKLKLQDTLKTPVYATQARRNAMGQGLVFSADLHTKEHLSKWILNGVALSLNVEN